MKAAARIVVAVGVLMAVPARADDSEFQPRLDSIASDYAAAKTAIAGKDWKRAVGFLDRAARGDPKDADVQNLLGYSYRKLGQMELAFKHYGRALELNPKHRGAHEYVGEAWLMAGNPAKAREHLGALERLCPSVCEERDDLKKAIAEYEKSLRAPASR